MAVKKVQAGPAIKMVRVMVSMMATVDVAVASSLVGPLRSKADNDKILRIIGRKRLLDSVHSVIVSEVDPIERLPAK